jgi:hypothetical protein
MAVSDFSLQVAVRKAGQKACLAPHAWSIQNWREV